LQGHITPQREALVDDRRYVDREEFVGAVRTQREAVANAMTTTGATSIEELIGASELLVRKLGHLPTSAEYIAVVALDDTEKAYLLENSSNTAIRSWHNTAAALLRQAATASGDTESAIARQGILTNAQRVLPSAARAEHTSAQPQGASTRGVRGAKSRAHRGGLRENEAGQRITPSLLAKEAGLTGGFNQTKAWMLRRNLSPWTFPCAPPRQPRPRLRSPRRRRRRRE
jgi:hypothetical protein